MKQPKVKRSITLDKNVHDALQKAAEEDSRNESSMINKILLDYLVKNGYLD